MKWLVKNQVKKAIKKADDVSPLSFILYYYKQFYRLQLQ